MKPNAINIWKKWPTYC